MFVQYPEKTNMHSRPKKFDLSFRVLERALLSQTPCGACHIMHIGLHVGYAKNHK